MLRFGEYASPKNFVFPTKRLLREMDRARWVRQLINETNIITIKNISLGEFHSAFLSNDQQIYTFGKNTFGQLGHGHNDIVLTPLPILKFEKIKIDKIAITMDLKRTSNCSFDNLDFTYSTNAKS